MSGTYGSNTIQVPTEFGQLTADIIKPYETIGAAVGTEITCNTKAVFILCHGLLNNRHSPVIQWFQSMLLRQASVIPSLQLSLVLLDFRGNGDSDGETDYGNYNEEAEDLFHLVSYLQQYHSTDLGSIRGFMGHSKAASVVQIYMDKYGREQICERRETGVTLILLSGRLNMSERHSTLNRFTAEQMEQLQTKGRFIWRQYKLRGGKEERSYWITAESLDKRHSTDMYATIRGLGGKFGNAGGRLKVSIVHGEMDKVVPCEDGREYQRLYAAAGIENQLLILPDVDHFYSSVTDETSVDMLENSFKRILKTFMKYDKS